MKAVIEVTDCQDCPFANDHRGHGECWKECCHPQHNQGAYGNILWGCGAQFKATPSWCPLKEKNSTKGEEHMNQEMQRIMEALMLIYGRDLQAATITVLLKDGDTALRYLTHTLPQVEKEK